MKASSKKVFAFFGASALAILAAPNVAIAQDADNTNEIIVTARQRSEALQDVPAQVTAFNAAAIEARGIQRPADFIAAVPNVTIVETQNAGTSFLVIRGISQARNSEPSAAIVVDGVPMTQPAQFNQELIDIQQIEVLKGPQGALYGRNAIGGAVLITTRKPSDEFEGRVTAGYESGPGYRLQGAANVPLADNFWMRGALSHFDTDGHLSNVNSIDATAQHDVDPVEDTNARVSFLYQPTDDFSVDLRLSTDDLKTRALYYTIPNFVLLPSFAPNPDFNDPNFTDQDINLNNSGQNERQIYDAALKLNYDAGYGTFSSITGYNSVREILTGDGYAFDPFGQSRLAPPFDFDQSQFLVVKTTTQEFRFTSPEERRFRWIAGAQFFWTDRFISTGNMLDLADEGVVPIYHTPNAQIGGFFGPQAQISFLADSQDQFAWAAYFDTSTQLTDQLELSVNVRYDRDRRENTTETPQEFLDANPLAGRGAIDATTGDVRTHTWDDFQPQVILRYEVNDNLNIYGSYSRGFRSGGFNQTGVGATAAANGFRGVNDLFDQETTDTFEAGLKTTFMDGRANLSASVYTTKDKGAYYFVFLAANSTQNLGNLDEVELSGFDVEFNARLTDNFLINAGFGLTDSEITKFEDPLVIGAKAPLVSDYTANLGAEYRQPLGEGIEGVVRVDYNRIGDTVFTIPFRNADQGNLFFLEPTPKERDPVDLVDLRIGVQGESWSLTAWSKNLLDEEYNTEYSPGGFHFRAQPMRWGVDLTKRF